MILVASMMLLSGCDTGDDSMNGTIFKDYWAKEPKDQENTTIIDEQIDFTPKETEGYLIGSYNLERFTVTKADNEHLSQGYEQAMNDYSIIALQEIDDNGDTAFREFMQAYMPRYSYEISDEVGESDKERYAFIWNEDVTIIGKAHMFTDVTDSFLRDPYMIHTKIGENTMVIINTHIDAGVAKREIDLLVKVAKYAREYYDEDNIIIVGTMYNDCYYTDGDFSSDYTEVIDTNMDTTTTRSDCSYDRIYSDAAIDIIKAGVDMFDDDGISEPLMKAMSDHHMVYMKVK